MAQKLSKFIHPPACVSPFQNNDLTTTLTDFLDRYETTFMIRASLHEEDCITFANGANEGFGSLFGIQLNHVGYQKLGVFLTHMDRLDHISTLLID